MTVTLTGFFRRNNKKHRNTILVYSIKFVNIYTTYFCQFQTSFELARRSKQKTQATNLSRVSSESLRSITNLLCNLNIVDVIRAKLLIYCHCHCYC